MILGIRSDPPVDWIEECELATDVEVRGACLSELEMRETLRDLCRSDAYRDDNAHVAVAFAHRGLIDQQHPTTTAAAMLGHQRWLPRRWPRARSRSPIRA